MEQRDQSVATCPTDQYRWQPAGRPGRDRWRRARWSSLNPGTDSGWVCTPSWNRFWMGLYAGKLVVPAQKPGSVVTHWIKSTASLGYFVWLETGQAAPPMGGVMALS